MNIDAQSVIRAFESDEIREKARAEQRQVLDAGVDHYPTLAVVTPQGLVEVGSPTASASDMKAQIEGVANLH
ncbi:hypothetical protein [Rothia terrae]|uniref:hypothetical protein n=1 Tax=Rothia terrae TaxID=396015 RepID=UPI0033FCBF1D